MKIKKILFAALAFAIAFAQTVSAETFYVTAGTLNVREQPTVESKIVGTLSFNSQVEAATASDGWYTLNTGGYVNAAYLTTEPYVGICEKDGNVDDRFVAEVNRQLSMLPDSLIKLFQDNGWHIYVTDRDIANTYFSALYKKVKGVTCYGSNSIYIEDRDSAMAAPLHEFGHAFDELYETETGIRITTTEEYKAAYAAEKEVLRKEYNITNHYDELEYMANAFKFYVEDKQRLSQACPQIYAILDNCLAGYYAE